MFKFFLVKRNWNTNAKASSGYAGYINNLEMKMKPALLLF